MSIWITFAPRPKALSVWQVADFEKAMRYAEATLAGVGISGNDHIQHGETALHVRRQTSDTEAASVMKTRRWRENYRT